MNFNISVDRDSAWNFGITVGSLMAAGIVVGAIIVSLFVVRRS